MNKSKLKTFLRKNCKGFILKIRKFFIKYYKFRICPKCWFWYEEYIKEILCDFVGIPIKVVKSIFVNNLVINIFLFFGFIFIENSTMLSKDRYTSVIISIFTILNLTNGYLDYKRIQANCKMSTPFVIEILNIFYTISWQICYFKTFGLGNTIITPKNSQAKNIKIDNLKFFKVKIEDIMIFIKGANNEIAKFYLYFGFVRFMQENVHHIITMNETIIPNLLQYENSANTKGRLAHLQRVSIYLIKKFNTLNQFKNSNDIILLEEKLRKISLKLREISIDTIEQDNIQQEQEKISLISQYQFSNKEVLMWKFNAEDLKQDLVLFLNLIKDLYPIFYKEAHIKEVKPKKL